MEKKELIKAIDGLTKAEAMNVIFADLKDFAKAEKFWKDNGAKTVKRGFFDTYLDYLLENELDEEGVKTYIEVNGSANNLKDKGFYTKIALAFTKKRKLHEAEALEAEAEK